MEAAAASTHRAVIIMAIGKETQRQLFVLKLPFDNIYVELVTPPRFGILFNISGMKQRLGALARPNKHKPATEIAAIAVGHVAVLYQQVIGPDLTQAILHEVFVQINDVAIGETHVRVLLQIIIDDFKFPLGYIVPIAGAVPVKLGVARCCGLQQCGAIAERL